MATLSECEREAAPAHERLLAAVSAADALPRGTAFEKVKGARDRLRGELSSAQRTNGGRAGEKRKGLRAPAQPTPEPDEEARHGCARARCARAALLRRP